MIVAITFWIFGWLFTCGMLVDISKPWAVWRCFGLLSVWPAALGVIIRDATGTEKNL